MYSNLLCRFFLSSLALLLVGVILSANGQDDDLPGRPSILQDETLDGFSENDDMVNGEENGNSMMFYCYMY